MKNSYFWIVLGFPVWKRRTEFSIRHKDWNDFNYKSTPSLGLILIGINNPVILSHKFVDLQCPTFYWKRWFSSDVKQKQQRVVVKIFHFMNVNFTDFRMKTANICCIHEKKNCDRQFHQNWASRWRRVLYKVFNLFLLFSSLPANSHLEISHGRDCRCSHAEDETLAKYTSPSHSSTRHDISVNKSKLEHLVWKKKEKSKPIPIYLAVYQENSLKCMRQFRHLCAFICRWEPKYCKVTVWKICDVYICSFLIRRVIVLTFYRDFIIFWCRYFFDLWDVFITYPLFYYRIFRRNVDQIPESIIKVKFNCYKCWVCMFLLNQIFGDVN